MIIRSAALALCLLSSFPAAAAAEDNTAVTDWSNLCLAARGDPGAVLGAADAAGWRRLAQGQGRYLEDSGGRHVVMIVDAGTRQCVVSHPTQNNVASALQAAIGQPPTYQDGGFSVWVADNVSGLLTWLSNQDAARARDAFTNGRAVTVRAGVQQGLDIVMYEFRP